MRTDAVSAATLAAWLMMMPLSGALRAESPAAVLLDQSIAFHDPDGSWSTGAYRLEIAESRPDGSQRTTEVVLDLEGGVFRYRSERRGRQVEVEVVDGECTVTLDGSSEISAEEEETHGLSCERLRRLGDYYTYLWGLPMKLLDAGTILAPDVTATSFDDRPVDALQVTYEEVVGSDTWYFYLDRDTRALVGYRFYHDEAANDGEYIVLEGEVAGGGLRLPRSRSWYTNDGDELLGVDTLISISRL